MSDLSKLIANLIDQGYSDEDIHGIISENIDSSEGNLNKRKIQEARTLQRKVLGSKIGETIDVKKAPSSPGEFKRVVDAIRSTHYPGLQEMAETIYGKPESPVSFNTRAGAAGSISSITPTTVHLNPEILSGSMEAVATPAHEIGHQFDTVAKRVKNMDPSGRGYAEIMDILDKNPSFRRKFMSHVQNIDPEFQSIPFKESLSNVSAKMSPSQASSAAKIGHHAKSLDPGDIGDYELRNLKRLSSGKTLWGLAAAPVAIGAAALGASPDVQAAIETAADPLYSADVGAGTDVVLDPEQEQNVQAMRDTRANETMSLGNYRKLQKMLNNSR